MLILLTTTVNHLRLGPNAPAGMVAAVMDDLGAELVANGQAVQITAEDFQRRLLPTKQKAGIVPIDKSASVR